MSGSKILLTDGWDELVKVAEGEKRFRKLSEKQLQRPGDDVNVLPLTVLQVQLLCGDTSGAQLITTQQGAPLSAVTHCKEGILLPYLQAESLKRELLSFTMICLEA